MEAHVRRYKMFTSNKREPPMGQAHGIHRACSSSNKREPPWDKPMASVVSTVQLRPFGHSRIDGLSECKLYCQLQLTRIAHSSSQEPIEIEESRGN